MKLIFISVFLLSAVLLSCQNKDGNANNAKDMPKPEEYYDQISYAIGTEMGMNFKRDSIPINYDYLIAGIIDRVESDSLKMTQEEISEVMMKFQEEMTAKMQKKYEKEQHRVDSLGVLFDTLSKTYLEENRKKPGVIETTSGLQYKIIEEGTGEIPGINDMVLLDFIAKLPNGDEFMNTYKNGEPKKIPVTGIPPGWSEMLKLIKVGTKVEFVIPPDLAYSSIGQPPKIPPNAALIFELELLDIVEPQTISPDQMMQMQQQQQQQMPPQPPGPR